MRQELSMGEWRGRLDEVLEELLEREFSRKRGTTFTDIEFLSNA